LAIYIEQLFPRHHVDCEYDKRIEPDEVTQKMREYGGRMREFRPDIIVHRRGKMQDNLLVIELKKNNLKGRRKDKATLKRTTDPVGATSINSAYS